MCYILICIDASTEGDISGRIFNAYYRDAIFFDNSMELIKKMEDIFDTFNYPHSTMDIRTLPTGDLIEAHRKKPEKIKVAPTTELIKHNAKGKIGTVKTRIMFRQNATWQGMAKWVEEELEENFTSTLELLMLLDSVVEGSKSDEDPS